MSRIQIPKPLLVVLATAMCTGILQANIQTSPSVSTIALTCDMIGGPGAAQTVGIVLATGSTTTTVTATATTAPTIVVTSTAQSVSSTTVATNFSFRIASGCTGVTNGTPVTITFTPATGTAITVSATITITGLVLSQSSVVLSCVHGGSPGSGQNVSVTSLAPGGSKFYVDQVTAPTPPTWLTISGGGAVGSQLTASATPTILGFTPAAGCSSLVAGTYTYTAQVVNPGTTNKTVAVTLTVGATNPLSVPAGTVMISYAKPSTANSATVTLSNANSPNAVFYIVDPTTLPSWLNVTPASQSFSTASTSLTFTPTAACAALAVGTYSANVHLKVSGSVDLVIAVSLEVQNAAPTLSILQGTSTTINWVLGSALPTLTITPISSDEPIAFTISTTGGSFVASYTPQYGIAYNFGTPVSITFSSTAFAGAAPGSQMSESMVVTAASGSVNFLITVNVLSPAATLTSIFPTALPVATSGSFNVTLGGSGFVTSGGSTQQTKVGIVSAGQVVTDTNIAVTLVNSSTITLVITLPTAGDPLMNFSSPTTVAIGVCNPNGSFCSTPTSQLTLMVGSVPIISAVTSGASYAQVTAPALTSVAPYDVLSIFGTNFCMIAAAGCTGSNAVLYATVAPSTLQYQNWLSPDGGTDKVTVGFYTHAASPSQIGSNAPLLFASNGQINVLVPSGVSTYVGQVVDIVVTYGPASTTNKSVPYSVLIANTDPGIFTIGGDGAGPAAALDVHFNVIGGSNPAHIGLTTSDTIQLYVAGLGLPDATSTNTNNWGSVTCLSPAQYVTALNNATGSSVSTADGLIIQSAVTSPLSDVAPCFLSSETAGSTNNMPTVTLGGIAATVTYAGWVADSVAGLYQINATLPSSAGFTSNASNFVDGSGNAVHDAALASGTTLPIVVTSRLVPSQGSVTLNVKGGGITVACAIGSPPAACTNTITLAANSTNWATIALTPSGGSGTYSYAATNLPGGLTLDASAGTVSGTVSSTGTSAVTFTVTDSNTGFTGTLAVSMVAQ